MANVWSRAYVESLRQRVDSDRAGVYLALESHYRPFNPGAADQLLIQAQIASGSGAFGGFALAGNLLAKFQSPDNYNLTLDDFSNRIVTGLLDAIVKDFDIGRNESKGSE